MSVEFSNTYQEILLENLMSIIKQNFMFQTQLKMVEETGTQKAELEAKLAEAQSKYDSIRPLVDEIDAYKQRALQNTSAHQEKDRIQTALNDYMRKHADLQAVIAERDEEIGKLKEYIDKLEQAVPVSKLKKINPEKKFEEPAPVIVPEEPPPTTTKQVVKDGSSF